MTLEERPPLAWMERATLLVSQVYEGFMRHVIATKVLDERVGTLGTEQGKAIEQGKWIDARVPRLMAISGKGGWHSDPVKRERYLQSANITLLDHLLSVMRGAMLLYALDALERTPDMDETRLRQFLHVIASLAFLHDLDKMLELERGAEIQVADVESAIHRYGITAFLASGSVEPLNAEQIRYLIEKVEGTESGRHFPQVLPPQAYERLTGYVGLADKLDGVWLNQHAETGGIQGVLRRLGADQTLQSDILRHWRAIELFDPHHPFLLDELQRWLSATSLRMAGIPPLIEIHQDGRLFMLLPESDCDRIVRAAIERLCRYLPFDLELTISTRGLPALANSCPGHDELRAFLDTLPARDLGNLFKMKYSLRDTVTAALDEWLGPWGLAPRWPTSAEALASPYADPSLLDAPAKSRLKDAAHLVLLSNLKITLPKGIPSPSEREQQLLDTLGQTPPDWVSDIKDPSSRRVLNALWTLAQAEQDPETRIRVWGDRGLLQRWLEGDESQAGINRFIPGQGPQIALRVASRFENLLLKKRLGTPDETESGRCLFTDEPVPFDDTIDQKLGLYGVKVAAFSGRENRPETITSELAHTNVGPVSIAEHRLRAKAHALQGGKSNGVPALVSSPSTLGLFGGLAMSSDQAMRGLSIYDLSRQDVKKGLVYAGFEAYLGRYRIARLERLADKTADLVDQIRLLLIACRRTGRPLHIFRGLPASQPAFFHFDAMPRLLSELIGGNSLRLEQISGALDRLRIAQLLLEANGLGYDSLRLYANPHTRFRAICHAWCHLRDGGSVADDLLGEYFIHRETQMMTKEDALLVRFGRSAARIQRRPGPQASGNDEMRVFNLCLDFALGARALGQGDDESLTHGIASELETNLVRKNKAAARQHRDNENLRAGCLEVADQFVREVWHGALKARPPTQRERRILGSIYRMAFLETAQAPKEPNQH